MTFYDIDGNIYTPDSKALANKKVLFIGDSNADLMKTKITEYMIEEYGCSFQVRAEGGQKWETNNGINTLDNSAVGRVNTLIADISVGDAITEFDYVLFMFGTNAGSTGDVTADGTDVTTMCGAMKYCMKRICYYGRKIKVGVIIPIRWIGQEGYEATELPSKFEKIKTIAKMYAVPVLDMYFDSRVIQNSQMVVGNEAVKDAGYLTTDNVHMGANGQEQFIKTFGKWVAFEL